jgi:hypothetical protein
VGGVRDLASPYRELELANLPARNPRGTLWAGGPSRPGGSLAREELPGVNGPLEGGREVNARWTATYELPWYSTASPGP